MAQQSQYSSSSIEHTIVDSDIHTAYRTEDIREKIASRLDEPFKTHHLRETLNYGPYPRDSFPKDPIGDSDYSEDSVVQNPEDVQRDLVDGMGIDVAVLNSLQKFDLVPNTERAVREMRAVNEPVQETSAG